MKMTSMTVIQNICFQTYDFNDMFSFTRSNSIKYAEKQIDSGG